MNVLILGATSAIAQSFAQQCADTNSYFALVGRHENRLSQIAADLEVRGAKSSVHQIDFDDLNVVSDKVRIIVSLKSKWDVVLVAYGVLGDPKTSHVQSEVAKFIIQNNYVSPAMVLTELAIYAEVGKIANIVVISSVAGDRGRQSNYVYGSAKAGLTAFLSGLRQRLHKSGVHVMTVKPGFVDTPMTKDFKKGPLWVSADKVAKDIRQAIPRKRDVIYTPWFWFWIMWVIRSIPEFLFKRLKL